VLIHVHDCELPATPWQDLVFDSWRPWKLYRHQDTWVFCLHASEAVTSAYSVAILEDDFSRGDIFLRRPDPGSNQRSLPLAFPMAELLMMGLLSRGRGVLLHALAVNECGRGLLFVGESGAGKSTLARLYQTRAGTTVLSDDRIIVRRHDHQYWIYGTPWHGDVNAVSPEGLPLDQVFLIRHGNENQARRLSAPQAAARLMQSSFSTYWDRDGLAFTLDFLAGLSETVPCYDLGFVPDGEVLEYVRCVR
jgi:hypothetical protein